MTTTTELSTFAQAGDLMHAQTEAATQLAHTLAYEGAVTVGGIEDHIRFYQRRSVEALLEVGKGLLLLKELTPHGEFEQRVEMLGISTRTAQRFMQATAKASKSATVALLAGQVKNQKAFLELVTHDEDVIEQLAEMDDIERMSASEVRALARELRADAQAKDAVIAEQAGKLSRAEIERKKLKAAPYTDWPAAYQGYISQVQKAKREIKNAITVLKEVRMHSLQNEAAPGEEGSLEDANLALGQELWQAYEGLELRLAQEKRAFEVTLGDALEADRSQYTQRALAEMQEQQEQPED